MNLTSLQLKLRKKEIEEKSFLYKIMTKLYIYFSYDVWQLPVIPIRDVIDRYSRQKKDIFFVQIGSNDGITADPISDFIRRDKWSGILVEPIEYLFKQLINNYKDQENLFFENVAISEKKELKKFYSIIETEDNICNFASGLGSFFPEVILSHKHVFPNIEKYLKCEEINCITFDVLLENYNTDRVDIIHLDTEGYDYEIIKQINFRKIKPDIILFEHKHLKIRDYKKCINYMRRNNYGLYKESDDTIAVLNTNSSVWKN